MSEALRTYMSPDSRYKTSSYERNGKPRFCLSEKTRKGTLITEFSMAGKITDQIYLKEKMPEDSLRDYLGKEINVEKINAYERIKVSASCKKCGMENKISRELDLAVISYVDNVPAVPMFKCTGCGERFYAMSDEYLELLVSRNKDLFKKEELEEIEKDRISSIKQLDEYIIRIFASKKITRLVIVE